MREKKKKVSTCQKYEKIIVDVKVIELLIKKKQTVPVKYHKLQKSI